MSKNQTQQLGRFHDELEKFTNKVIRLEKHVRLPRYADEKSDCFSIDTDKTTIPPDNGSVAKSVFTQVRTRKCLPFKHVARNINSSRSSTDNSFGQICVERVYFAENHDKANVENSQESLQHTLSNPNKTQTGNTNGLSFEISEFNQRNSYGLSMIAKPDTVLQISRPVRSETQLFAKGNKKNIPGYELNGLKSNESRNVDVVPDARDFKKARGVSDVNFTPGKKCVYPERSTSRVINSSASSASCYKQREEIRQPAEKNVDGPCIQNFNIFSQPHKSRASFTSTLSEGREGLTRYYGDVQTVQPIETQPNYFKPSFTNVQKMLYPMAQTQVHGGVNQVMRDYFAIQQGIDSRFISRAPLAVFHSDNDQRICSAQRAIEPDKQNFSHRMMQHWLQTNETHRQQYRTDKFNQNESQSDTSENATSIIKSVAKRQRTERSNLHPDQITGNPSKGKLTTQRNNTKYSSTYCSPSSVMETVVCGSSIEGKFTESGTSEERTCANRNSLESNKQIISIDRVALNRRSHISQNAQTRAYSDSVIGLQNQFISQRTSTIEMDMQKNFFGKRAKKEANVQVTLLRQPTERHSKATQKISRATEASLDISSTKKPKPSVVHQETTNVSKPICFIQDANKNDSVVARNNQPCGYRKRKTDGNENDETVIKNQKSIRQKNSSVEGNKIFSSLVVLQMFFV